MIFLGEEGIDEGGVRKEFFQLLVEQLFSENFGMFVNMNKGSMVAEQLWFSKDCVWSDEEFMLTGMLIGKSVGIRGRRVSFQLLTGLFLLLV